MLTMKLFRFTGFFQYHLPLNTKKPLTMMDESYLRKERKYKHQSEIFTKEMCR